MQDRWARADRMWRYGALGLSVLLYLSCLPLEAFCVNSACSGWPGYGILIFGPLGLIVSATNWTWLANPVLFGAWAMLAAVEFERTLVSRFAALVLGSVAFAISISFLFQRKIVTNEAGILFPITGYRIGYWLWLSSIAVCCFGSVVTIALSVGRKNQE